MGTLVNPNRDVGATHIHRIDWHMIKDAPASQTPPTGWQNRSTGEPS